jgi:Uma2 family endonuclease
LAKIPARPAGFNCRSAFPGTSKRDKLEKFELYERYGVREYWMFDTQDRVAEVWVHNAKRFERLGIFSSGEPFTSPALGKAVDLSLIFP